MITSHKFLGIDPGKGGGIAMMDISDGKVIVSDMPDTEKDIAVFFQEAASNGYTRAMIEKVWGRPGMGGTTMFSFGASYGSVRMAMIANGISFDEVIPRTWQKYFSIPPKKKTETSAQHKNKLKAKAQQLFAEVKITLKNADAVLICEYLRRKSS